MNGAKMVRWCVTGVALLGISIVIAVNGWRQPMTQDEREIIRELKKTSGNSFEYDSHGGVEFGGPATTLPRLGAIRSLVRIDVGWNTLCTDFDERHLECLRGMPNLRRLNFYGHPVSGPALKVLTTLPALEGLHCTPTDKVVEALQYIGQCHKLRSLGIGNSKVTDESLAGLTGLENLETLDLCRTLVHNDLSPLAHLTKLRGLDVGDTDLTIAAIRQIGRMTWLERLHLPNVTDEALSSIRDLTQVNFLSFERTPALTDAGIKHLQNFHNLKKLYMIGGGPFRDSELRILATLKQLHVLDLNHKTVNPGRRQKLEAELPDCRIHWCEPYDGAL